VIRPFEDSLTTGALSAPSRSTPQPVGVRPRRLALVVAVGLLVWALPRPDVVDPRAWRLFAIFVMTVVGVVVQPLPMGAVALVGLSACLATGALTIGEALSGFSNGTVWLVVSAFLLAVAFIKTGLGARIAYVLIMLFGQSTLGLGYSLVAADLVLAPAIPSNTARAGGVIFPILQALSKTSLGGETASGRLTRSFLTLTVYNGTVITSAMFLTAMVANPLMVQLSAAQGITITWSMWALCAVAPGTVSLVAIPFLIYRLCPPGMAKTPDAPASAKLALAHLGPMDRRAKLLAVASVLLLVAWILGPSIDLDVTAAALIAIMTLLLTGVLEWDDIIREHEAWNTFIWFASLVTMATYLGQSGLMEWFTRRMGSSFEGIGWVPGFLVLSLVYFYSHYAFASITTHVSAMYAPFLAVALALGTPPLLAALILNFFSNLFASLTHYGTAPAPILFGGGHVSLATWWRVGAIVSVANIAIWVVVGGAWWKLLGLW
jgi:divalent anion:Na+ symporter, DASS family